MALNFTTTSQSTKVNGVKMLAYSMAGVGKTVMCATLPAPIVLSAESGMLSLARRNIERIYGVNAPGITYDLPVIIINSVQDLNDAYNWVAQSAEARQFGSIALDSITEIAEQVLANAKRTNKDPRKAYGDLVDIMLAAIKLFRDLPGKHIYMSSKMEMNKDEVTGIMKYGPMMPGKQVGQQLPYLFDEVFRLAVGKGQDGKEFRYLQTQPDLQYDAKDRSGMLDQFELPNLTHVINKIVGA